MNDYPAPEWVATLSGNYQRGPFGLYLQARYTDDILINRDWNYNGASTQWDVYDNVLEAEILVDTRLNYVFKVAGGDLNLFTTVNNLFDKAPQSYLTEETNSFIWNATTLGVYGDLRGRRYVAGVNYEYHF